MTDYHNQLLINIKSRRQEIEKTLTECCTNEDDMLYRYYHESFKVYKIQEYTSKMVVMIKSLDPREQPESLNSFFEKIVSEGTGRAFRVEDNQNWEQVTRPMLEAYFHSASILHYAIESADWLDEAPDVLPSRWALVLYIYNLR